MSQAWRTTKVTPMNFSKIFTENELLTLYQINPIQVHFVIG